MITVIFEDMIKISRLALEHHVQLECRSKMTNLFRLSALDQFLGIVSVTFSSSSSSSDEEGDAFLSSSSSSSFFSSSSFTESDNDANLDMDRVISTITLNALFCNDEERIEPSVREFERDSRRVRSSTRSRFHNRTSKTFPQGVDLLLSFAIVANMFRTRI